MNDLAKAKPDVRGRAPWRGRRALPVSAAGACLPVHSTPPPPSARFCSRQVVSMLDTDLKKIIDYPAVAADVESYNKGAS